jgi:hypothetical protein
LRIKPKNERDLRFQSHHRLTRFALFDPELQSQGNHQIHQPAEYSLFSGLNDIGIDLNRQLELTGLSGGDMILIIYGTSSVIVVLGLNNDLSMGGKSPLS